MEIDEDLKRLTKLEASVLTLAIVRVIREDPRLMAGHKKPTRASLDCIRDAFMTISQEAFLVGQAVGIRESDAAYEEILELALEPSRN